MFMQTTVMRNFDEKTPMCENCGWYGHDIWPTGENAGKQYERCGKYGYVLHRMSDKACEGFQTPADAKKFVDRYNMKAKVKLTYDRQIGGVTHESDLS